MLSNYKNSHMMREKMKVAKPEVDGIQERLNVREHKKKNGCKPRTYGSL